MELKSLTEQKSLLAALAPGKRARLRRLLFEFGPGNGTLLLLPIDQGIEHGPRDFFPNPASKALEIIEQIKETLLSSVSRIP
jgi:DhnA family fructose-bisphosphate aldolase class Ia